MYFRYVPLYYSDGDQCELTKTSRTVEVKLRYKTIICFFR